MDDAVEIHGVMCGYYVSIDVGLTVHLYRERSKTGSCGMLRKLPQLPKETGYIDYNVAMKSGINFG